MYQYCYDKDKGNLFRVHVTKNTVEHFNWKTKVWELSKAILKEMPLLVIISKEEMLRLTEEDSIYVK